MKWFLPRMLRTMRRDRPAGRRTTQKKLDNEQPNNTRDDLNDLIQHAFREVKPGNAKETGKFLDFGIDALKELHKMMIMRSRTSIYHNEDNNVNIQNETIDSWWRCAGFNWCPLFNGW